MENANNSSVDASGQTARAGVPVPELLAPAGNGRSLVAAVQSGADAVYAGLRDFSARRGAENFSLDELEDAARYAHLRGVRLYLTANVLILPREMDRALSLCAGARDAGVDAFIVQDLGLARLLSAQLPDVPLHASTQMSIHSIDGVSVLASLGFDRVTLARELSLDEVGRLAAGPVPVEVFVHGALCYCYSGQCLLSSMVGGRSGNRGLCVQACRLAYELFDDARGPIEAGGDYPLCTKDLSAIDLIPGLARAGVASLKIEGRLKSAEYVATVVDVYRRALDTYAADPSGYSVARRDREALEEVFSRGFTEGYLAGIRDSRMMGPARPSDRGAAIGRVTGSDFAKHECGIKLTRDLAVGDEIEIWVRKGGRVGAKIRALEVTGVSVEVAGAGQVATVRLDGRAGMGDRVFRTMNGRLMEAARQRLRPGGATRTVPVDLNAKLRVGDPLQLSGSVAGGPAARVTGTVVEGAREKALDAKSVAEHLARLGGTAYAARDVNVDLGKDCFLAPKEIHAARAALVEKLDEVRLAAWLREPASVEYALVAQRSRRPTRPMLCASVDTVDLALELTGAGLDWLYLDISFERDRTRLGTELPRISGELRASGGRFALQLPAILRNGEMGDTDRLIETLAGALDGVVVGSVAQAYRYAGTGGVLIGDLPLNATNRDALDVLAGLDLDRVTLSPEITAEQIDDIARATRMRLETLVFGRLQVMVAEHCVYCVPGSCAGCDGRSGSLRDAKGFVFPVRIDTTCRTRIYNPFDISLIKQTPEIGVMGVDAVRLNLGGYAAQPALEVVEGLRNVVSLLPEEPEAAAETAERLSQRLSERTRYTTGHYYRPVR